jgi:hypothetical protein
MPEKLSQFAERSATNASRREFLGQFGRVALVIAGGVGGLLARPATTQAARKPYICPEGSWWRCVGQPEGTACDFGSVCKRIKHSTLCTCSCKPGNKDC